MQTTVLRQIDEINRMSMRQLRKRWTDLMGGDPGRLGRQYLIRRLCYRVQELAFGGLSKDARHQLARVADGKTPRAVKERKKRRGAAISPGTRLLREYRGQMHEVIASEDGFLYAGKTYKSLTAVARAISGTHWNGNLFFGISRRKSGKGKA